MDNLIDLINKSYLVNKTLELAIFNKVKKSVRIVEIYPEKNWGGEVLLGCELAFGVLN